MKIKKEIKLLDAKAIYAQICSSKRRLLAYRLQKTSGALDKTHLVRQCRREIACLKTFLNAKKRSK